MEDSESIPSKDGLVDNLGAAEPRSLEEGEQGDLVH